MHTRSCTPIPVGHVHQSAPCGLLVTLLWTFCSLGQVDRQFFWSGPQCLAPWWSPSSPSSSPPMHCHHLWHCNHHCIIFIINRWTAGFLVWTSMLGTMVVLTYVTKWVAIQMTQRQKTKKIMKIAIAQGKDKVISPSAWLTIVIQACLRMRCPSLGNFSPKKTKQSES